MERVVDYSRVSTEEEQQKSALVIQREENCAFIASKEGWVHVDSYVDEAKSGTTMIGRSDFIRMLSDMREDKYDTILIKQIDRGWRNLADWKMFESELIEYNKKLFIRLKNEYYDIEDDGKYISATMDNVFSEWHSRNLSKKINSAHKTRMKKGTVVTNGKLWGYDQVKGTAELVINEEEAEVVRLVFNLYIQNVGFRKIVQELADRGITSSNGTPLTTTTLNRMIRNEKYKGVLVCGKRHKNFFTKKYEHIPEEDWIIHENRIPAIVDEDIWEKANEILRGKRRHYSVEEQKIAAGYFHGSYALSGKIKCGLCGSTYYHGSYSTSKTKDTRRYCWNCKCYKMYGKNHKAGCANITVKEDDLNHVIKEIAFEFWKDKEKTLQNVKSILDSVIVEDNYEHTIKKLMAEKDRLISKKDKLLDLYTDDVINKEEFKKRNEIIDSSYDSISEEIQQLSEQSQGLNSKKDRLAKIMNFLETELRSPEGITDEFIKVLVDEVIVYPDRTIDITINGKHFPNVPTFRQNRSSSANGFCRIR
jgi:DNA invertase Pin-like site-specific DNA recombinase